MSEKKDEQEAPGAVAADAEAGGGETEKTSEETAQSRPVKVADDKAKLAKAAKAARKHSQDNVILVPVDFSDHSQAALVFAAELAESMSARLVILHVVHDPGEMPGYYSKLVKKKRVDRIQDIAKDVFDDFLKQVIGQHREFKSLRKAENLMVVGLPVTRILQVVEKFEPFMLVMGSKGRTGLKHLFLGSKAEQVVHLCPVPVTIVKQKK